MVNYNKEINIYLNFKSTYRFSSENKKPYENIFIGYDLEVFSELINKFNLTKWHYQIRKDGEIIGYYSNNKYSPWGNNYYFIYENYKYSSYRITNQDMFNQAPNFIKRYLRNEYKINKFLQKKIDLMKINLSILYEEERFFTKLK